MFLLRLPFSLAENFRLERPMLAALPHLPWSRGLALLPAFALSEPERNFARELLRLKKNLWLYRCNQKLFCGDFIIVDMSSPRPHARAVLCLELKEGREPEYLESPGLQLQRANEAMAEISAKNIITSDSPRGNYIGNQRGMLRMLRRESIHKLVGGPARVQPAEDSRNWRQRSRMGT